MNCEFCTKPLTFSHEENGKEVKVYDCKNCPVLTSFHFLDKDSERIKTSFFIDKNEKVYIWTNNYVRGISYITDVGIRISLVKDKDPLVIKFPKIMSITPQNVYEKFSFYMTFL